LDVQVGDAVLVPFGRQVVQGVVMERSDASDIAHPRPIHDRIRDDEIGSPLDASLLTPARARLAAWIAEAYVAPPFSAAALFLPPGFNRKPRRLLRPLPVSDPAALAALGALSRDVLETITRRRLIDVDALQRSVGVSKVGPTIRALVRQGLVDERYELSRPAVGVKHEQWLTLARSPEDARAAVDSWPRSRASRPADLLERLLDGPIDALEANRIAPTRKSVERWLHNRRAENANGNGHEIALAPLAEPDAVRAAIDSLRRTGVERRQIALVQVLLAGPRPEVAARHEANAAAADVHALVDAGLVRRESREVVRNALAAAPPPLLAKPTLTVDQARAFRAVADALDRQADGAPTATTEDTMFLLRGVTGSGKTEVYLDAVEHARTLGGRAIMMVPEIALTPQIVERFSERFPGRVAVLHSALSQGQAFDEWRRIRRGDVDVVIGSRSALFAPVPELALVIVDEEHEWTYKQTDPAPRYHVREVLERYCRLTGIVAVLASATPDVVTSFRASAGRYRLLELPHRVTRSDPTNPSSPLRQAPLPEVEIVDMREELRNDNRRIFSRALADSITTALEADEQVILFLNRRGVAAYVCRACGAAVECDRCSVPYTYHDAPRPPGVPRDPTAGLLRCHECGQTARPVARCPQCDDLRLRPMGLGTQRLEDEVASTFPLARPLRWDRDTAIGPDGHARLLAQFRQRKANVLVGTQMIAKGLDLPAVTVVGVINADSSLRLPDFTGPERTFQLITQVAGRAGRGPRGGRVVVQTYAPDHYAIRAAAAHDYEAFYAAEIPRRAQVDYPPHGRLARLVYAHETLDRARSVADEMAASLIADRDRRGLAGPEVLGPTPAYIARRRGRFRQQITLRGADPLPLLRTIDFERGWTIDIDPVSLL
jgi:primosomal protein N' (replication factor Y)